MDREQGRVFAPTDRIAHRRCGERLRPGGRRTGELGRHDLEEGKGRCRSGSCPSCRERRGAGEAGGIV